ncbi:hypothetical protein [Sediminispirochaeta bajacaliforniensis]|uniref:hypothetical protein n=1 Tax=Sediminispirochaeta bajacaliforniensis TaxID=148 RepID=UPI00035D01F1|nr:hypothetical protein [Sediminispirochaeta bajacaliforniensis]
MTFLIQLHKIQLEQGSFFVSSNNNTEKTIDFPIHYRLEIHRIGKRDAVTALLSMVHDPVGDCRGQILIGEQWFHALSAVKRNVQNPGDVTLSPVFAFL